MQKHSVSYSITHFSPFCKPQLNSREKKRKQGEPFCKKTVPPEKILKNCVHLNAFAKYVQQRSREQTPQAKWQPK